MSHYYSLFFFFFFNDTATTEIYTLSLHDALPISDGVPFEQGACLGIPGITAHRAVHAAGPVAGRTLLVQGGAGAVGVCAGGLARLAGARGLATGRSGADAARAEERRVGEEGRCRWGA